MEKVDISIIIPEKNEAERIDKVLHTIFSQETTYSFEVIVIDSGSTDGTLDILKKYNVRLYKIDPQTFSHSRTRNYGASLSIAEQYLIFLNGDAIPIGTDWLNNMVKSIRYHKDLKAVCAMEIDNHGDSYKLIGVTSFVFRSWKVEGIYIIEPYIMSRLASSGGKGTHDLFPFTTVCAIFEKAHFDKFPFNEKVDWAEDLHWAVDNSNKGYLSACASFAKVFHLYVDYDEELKEKLSKAYEEIFGTHLYSNNWFIKLIKRKCLLPLLNCFRRVGSMLT